MLRKLADDTFSLYIRTRDGWRCRHCGKTPDRSTLQCAHIMPKGDHPAGRYDEQNALCLCWGCHRYFTGRWYEWMQFVAAKVLGSEQAMHSLGLACMVRGTKHDYVATIIVYRRKLENLPGYAAVRDRAEALGARGRKLGVPWVPWER